MSDAHLPEPGSPPPSVATAVYVVGTEADVCELGNALQAVGFLVQRLDPHALLASAGAMRPALVVLDIEAAGALEATRRLADVPGGSDIELLLIGGATNPGDAPMDVPQCVGLFERPIEPTHIVSAVRALVVARAGARRQRDDEPDAELKQEHRHGQDEAIGSGRPDASPNTMLSVATPSLRGESLPPSSLEPDAIAEYARVLPDVGPPGTTRVAWRVPDREAWPHPTVAPHTDENGLDAPSEPTDRPIPAEQGRDRVQSGAATDSIRAKHLRSTIVSDREHHENEAPSACVKAAPVTNDEAALDPDQERLDDAMPAIRPTLAMDRPLLNVAPRFETTSPPSSGSSTPELGSVWPASASMQGGGLLAHAALAVPTSISSDLKKLLVAAEQRVFSEDVALDVLSPEAEVDAILPPGVLAALDDPLEVAAEDEEGDASSVLTPVGTRTSGRPRADGVPQNVHRTGGTDAGSSGGPQEPETSPGGDDDPQRAGLEKPEARSPTPRPSPTDERLAGMSRAESAGTVRNRHWASEDPFAQPPGELYEAQRESLMTPRATLAATSRGDEGPTLPRGGGEPPMRPREERGEPPMRPREERGEPPMRPWGAPAEPPTRPWGARLQRPAGAATGDHAPAIVSREAKIGEWTRRPAEAAPTGVPDAVANRLEPRIMHVDRADGPVAPPPTGPSLPQVLSPSADGLRVLGRCIGARVSASLCLEHDGTLSRAVLREGDFVTCGSSDVEESLVSFLVLRGDLPRDVGATLAGRIPPFGRHAAAALIANGFLSQDQLWPVLRAHAEWMLARLALMQQGTCTLEQTAPGRLRAEPAVFGGATGAEVLVEVAQRILPVDAALARLGGHSAKLGPGPKKALLSECALSEEAREAVEGAPGRSVQDVIDEVGQAEFASVLVALVALGVLDALPMIGLATAPRKSASVDPLDTQAVRKRVAARLALIEEGNYFEVLGVSRSATSYEIRRAYLETRRAFDPSSMLTPATAELADDLQLVLEVLEEAYDVLRDQARRERYRRAIDAAPPGS